MRDLTMENPIRAIREISHDVTGRRKVRLANGREASALDIQGEYLAKARDFVDRRGISTPVIERTLDLWERGLKAVESDDLGLVDREIDWVIKWKLIDRYRAKHGLPLSHPRVAQLDLAYHDIHRNRGLYYLLEKRGAVARVTSDLRIFEAKSVPPQNTRARFAASSSARRRSAAATSRSTGCTSSSTTRPSGPCCARTRSGRTTSASSASSTGCSAGPAGGWSARGACPPEPETCSADPACRVCACSAD